ncbi:hypothetical protein C8R48DRAFT_667673 [Suillus tomentosus]|nr:hypothetical protein C8R48DRAFT_667673 [Suillus tomentosus]
MIGQSLRKTFDRNILEKTPKVGGKQADSPNSQEKGTHPRTSGDVASNGGPHSVPYGQAIAVSGDTVTLHPGKTSIAGYSKDGWTGCRRGWTPGERPQKSEEALPKGQMNKVEGKSEVLVMRTTSVHIGHSEFNAVAPPGCDAGELSCESRQSQRVTPRSVHLPADYKGISSAQGFVVVGDQITIIFPQVDISKCVCCPKQKRGSKTGPNNPTRGRDIANGRCEDVMDDSGLKREDTDSAWDSETPLRNEPSPMRSRTGKQYDAEDKIHMLKGQGRADSEDEKGEATTFDLLTT